MKNTAIIFKELCMEIDGYYTCDYNQMTMYTNVKILCSAPETKVTLYVNSISKNEHIWIWIDIKNIYVEEKSERIKQQY